MYYNLGMQIKYPDTERDTEQPKEITHEQRLKAKEEFRKMYGAIDG